MQQPSFPRTAAIIAPPCDIQTGSLALDQDLTSSGAHTGDVLHLFGGGCTVQLALLLGVCLDACVRGKRTVFLDLSGALSHKLIERAGLWHCYNPNIPSDANALFRVLSPPTTQGIDDGLKAVAQSTTGLGVVVIHGLPDLLERQYLQGGTKAAKIAHAGKVLYILIQKAHLLFGKTSATVWIAHSPSVTLARGRASGKANRALPRKLLATIANTLEKHANYGVELGKAVPWNIPPTRLGVRVKVWRLGTLLNGSRKVGLGKYGRLTN